MKPALLETQPVSSSPPNPPLSSPSPLSPPSKKPFLIIGIFLLFFLAAGGVFFLGKTQNNQEITVTSPLSVYPSLIPTSDPTANWKTYTNNQYGFSISFPSDFEINKQADNQSFIIERILNRPGKNSNFLYITIITTGQNMIKNNIYAYDPKETNILLDMQIGVSKSIRPKDLLSKFWTYRRIQDVSIDGLQARSFENNNPWEFPPGTIERKMYLTKGNMMYIIGFLYGKDLSENFFNQILSTFKFLNSSPTTDYCNNLSLGGPFTRINDCGNFKVLVRPCCDQLDVIIDQNGNKITECGGIAGYSKDCKQRFLPQTSCVITPCNKQ